MRPFSLFILATVGIALSAQAAEFIEARVANDGGELTIIQGDGATLLAPTIEDQDGFEMPRVSNNHRYVGWLALFPHQGASYSQPIYLVVLDSKKRILQFSGDFGMVFSWCFAKNSNAVIYRYQFPHGETPIGFDVRRLKDGKLLHRSLLEPIKPEEDESQVIRAKAPAWTRCAQDGAAE